jgi:UDP-glucuronate 4-epimerase
MNFLITGCAGFIGFHLTKKLINNGHKVTGIDSLSDYYDTSLKKIRLSKLENKNFRFLHKDINLIEEIDSSIDIIINLAAQAGVRAVGKYKEQYQKTNIDGFKNILELYKKSDARLFLYASSSSVYDDCNPPFSEKKTLLKPKSEYGKSKLLNEELAENISVEKSSIIGLRFFTVYGNYGRPDMAYYLFTKKLNDSEEIVLYNEGKMSRDMTHVDDIVDGILLAIDYGLNKNFTHEIFNLGNNQPISTKNLLEHIEKYFNKKAKVKNLYSLEECITTHANLDKSVKYLSYNPKVQFSDGLKSFFEWYENYENKK